MAARDPVFASARSLPLAAVVAAHPAQRQSAAQAKVSAAYFTMFEESFDPVCKVSCRPRLGRARRVVSFSVFPP